MDDNSRKYIAKYVEDLHSLISHGLQPFSHQVGEAESRGHDEIRQLIERFHWTLQSHERMLNRHLDRLGSSPTTGVQDAAAGVAGAVAGLYNQVRTEAVSKSLRDDYTFLSHCSISWLMLMTTARSLGDHETEELGERGYRDCARMLMDIDRAMPGLVVHELRQDHFPAQDVGEWAQHLVHAAWDRQATGSGIEAPAELNS
jgi:hypothetical protein